MVGAIVEWATSKSDTRIVGSEGDYFVNRLLTSASINREFWMSSHRVAFRQTNNAPSHQIVVCQSTCASDTPNASTVPLAYPGDFVSKSLSSPPPLKQATPDRRLLPQTSPSHSHPSPDKPCVGSVGSLNTVNADASDKITPAQPTYTESAVDERKIQVQHTRGKKKARKAKHVSHKTSAQYMKLGAKMWTSFSDDDEDFVNVSMGRSRKHKRRRAAD